MSFHGLGSLFSSVSRLPIRARRRLSLSVTEVLELLVEAADDEEDTEVSEASESVDAWLLLLAWTGVLGAEESASSGLEGEVVVTSRESSISGDATVLGERASSTSDIAQRE